MTRLMVDDVTDWEKRDRNERRPWHPDATDPCHFCGKGLRNVETGTWVEMTTGGELLTADDPRRGTDESQGWFPVGSECARRIPKAFRLRLPESE